MAVDFAIICSLVRPGRPRYPVLVHRAATLLHASSGRRLAMTPLRFANPSPPSGWIEDFHLQAVDHARHTEKSPAEAGLVSRCHHLQACRAEENHHRRPSKPATSYTRRGGPPQERQGSVAIERAARVPVGGHKAFVPPSSAVEVWAGSAVEVWAGNGARGRGMRYSLELIVFVGAPTLGWFIFFG